MKALIDWLQFTYIPVVSPDNEDITPNEIISDFLCLNPNDFKPRKGLYWYKEGLEHENVSVFYDGINEGMGFHIQISGKGCRYMETIKDFQWHLFLNHLMANGCQFTRLDVAIDDRKFLNMDTIREHLQQGNVVTRFREYSKTTVYKFSENKRSSDTIYFGVRASDVFMRIYDKSMESKGKIDAIRFETVLKHEKAENFIKEYINPENFYNLSYLIEKVINNYIRFVKKKENNSSRSVMADWWAEFIETAEKLSLSNGQEDITMEKVCSWYERQVASGLKLLMETKGPLYVEGVLYRARMNSKHKRLKERYQREQRLKVVNE
jgi:phage replication initiation protein